MLDLLNKTLNSTTAEEGMGKRGGKRSGGGREGGEESKGKRKRWDERGEEMVGHITKEKGGVGITFLHPYQSSLCSLHPWERYRL